MRARSRAAGLESGVWYGRCKPAMDRTTYNASYYGGSKFGEREREREWVWQQSAVPMGKNTRMVPQSISGCPAVRPEGEKQDRTKQNKT